jgi:hypothetical protein
MGKITKPNFQQSKCRMMKPKKKSTNKNDLKNKSKLGKTIVLKLDLT